YHLDYADPFVQSVGQYLGRRIWHQVLLPFNLLARLLPPNPTEEDLRPLFRSMQRVSSRVLLQTDIEWLPKMMILRFSRDVCGADIEVPCRPF
ncbi:unnamed protein product, partial [Symbiodinium necroappetens]